MAVGTILGILGSVLGAGGSVAGGILSKPENPEPILPPQFNPASDPLTLLNTLDLLASQGVFAPDSFLAQAGPLQQAINAFRSTPGANRDPGALDRAINDFLNGDSTSTGADVIARAGGFRNVAEAHAAQQAFEESIGPRLNNLREIADLSRRRGLDVNRQLAAVTEGFRPLNFESLRQTETRDLEQEFQDRQREILRQANAGGFNPGGSLQGLERRRGDIDLEAISRAIGLLSGQATSTAQQISTLNALDPGNRSQQLAPSVLQFRIPQQVGSTGFFQPPTDPFGASVGAAANQLGGTVSSLGLIKLLLQNQEKPGLVSGSNFNPSTGQSTFIP